MYLGLVFCIAEMGAALPHTGGAYSFARASMGPWGGFITGLCENVEYVLTPAVVVSFLATYLGRRVRDADGLAAALLGRAATPSSSALNVCGVELSFRVTVVVTLAALACLAVFWITALPVADFKRYALNIGAGPDGTPVELPEGDGPLLPFGLRARFAALPFAVWLFLAIEQLPLAAEESLDPSRDMPRGIIAGLLTLFVSAALILWLNPVGRARAASSSASRASRCSTAFAPSSATGLGQGAGAGRLRRPGRRASTPSCSPRAGRSIRCRAPATSRASCRSPMRATRRRYVALLAGSAVALAIMFALWFGMGAEKARPRHPGHAAQHGGGRRHALLSPAGRELHRAAPAPAAARAPLPLAARHRGRDRDPGHRRW